MGEGGGREWGEGGREGVGGGREGGSGGGGEGVFRTFETITVYARALCGHSDELIHDILPSYPIDLAGLL